MTDQADHDLPLAPGDRGEAVRDLARRLVAAGFGRATGAEPVYDQATEGAVEDFQRARGLPVTGTCDALTWSALVEAGYQLGDRLLYLRAPMLRGDDVGALQLRLSALGFDTGRVDGIFGPDTERALKDFQRNMALTVDGVCGRDVLRALQLLGPRIDQPTPVAGVRERMRQAPKPLSDRRVVVGELGGLDAVTTALARSLHHAGATVAVLQHPEPSVQATEANLFQADAYLGLEVAEAGPCQASFYATTGFESEGGHLLATLVLAALAEELGLPTAPPRGMRLPILRETRMPAVLCSLGPVASIVDLGTQVPAALAHALAAWSVGSAPEAVSPPPVETPPEH